MRCETELEKREVMVVWLKEGMKYISVSPCTFTDAVRRSGMGRNQEKRDFLGLNSSDVSIVKNDNNVRRSCTAVFLDKLPLSLNTELRDGNFFLSLLQVHL